MSAPVLSWLFNALKKGEIPEGITPSSASPGRKPTAGPRSPFDQSAQSNVARESHCHGDPQCPTLRANPFPEVTDLFCRLPLSTLFYRPEASHLGDLMRLWVRPGVRISHSAGFSRDVASVPNGSKIKPLSHTGRPLSPGNPIPGAAHTVNKKRKLLSEPAPPSPASLVSPLDIHVLVREY